MRIDIHSHLMNVAFLEHLQGRGTLPTAARDADGYVTHCAPLFSLHYRAPILDVEAKLQDMDAAGIDLAVLSPALPGPAMLGGPQADSWAARINDELAVITAACPTRFAGWASLGFGDPRRTIAEVDRSLDELGLAGFQVWSNIGGRPLDAPDVLPVLEHIAGRGAAIHLHPTLPPGRQAIDAATMTGFSFPVDTSLAVLRLTDSTSTPSATSWHRWSTATPSSAPTGCCSAPTTRSRRLPSPGSSSAVCPAPAPNASRSWPATPSACCGSTLRLWTCRGRPHDPRPRAPSTRSARPPNHPGPASW